jgi:hypothetical protein
MEERIGGSCNTHGRMLAEFLSHQIDVEEIIIIKKGSL